MSRPAPDAGSAPAADASLQLRPSRGKHVLFLAGALAFVRGGMFLVRNQPLAALPDTCGRTADKLAELLNRWRTAHGGGADMPAPTPHPAA